MLQPDSDGCINVEWPSRNIPHGGIFHPKKVNYSKEREELLKVLLEESKLSILQRKKTAWDLRQHDETSKQHHPQLQIPPIRPRTSRRRSLSCIRDSGAFDYEEYRPRIRGEDRDKLKMRLQNVMAHGNTGSVVTGLPPNRRRPKSPSLPTVEQMKNELLTQIRERVEWLAEMEALGRGAEHREIIQDQIAERLRNLEALGIDFICPSARSVSTAKSNVSEPKSSESLKTQTARSGRATSKEGKAVRSNGGLVQSGKIGAKSTRDSQDSAKSACSLTDQQKRRNYILLKKELMREENVAAFDGLSPIQYTPRRRC